MNLGRINGKKYTKILSFSKAVLWKDRQLSIPPDIMQQIEDEGCETMEFIDHGKNEKWIFKVSKVQECMVKKMVGQEPQYYFPIDIAKKEELIDIEEKIKQLPEDERDRIEYLKVNNLPFKHLLT